MKDCPWPKWLLKWQPAEIMEANACAGESQCLKAQEQPCHLVSNGSVPTQVIYLFFITAVLRSLSCARGWWFKPRVFKLQVNTTLWTCELLWKDLWKWKLLLGDIIIWYWGLHVCEKMHRYLKIRRLDCLYSKVWLNKVVCTKIGERP